MTLDDLERIQRLDSEDMLGHINALPDQLEAAWARARQLDLPLDPAGVRQVVICGMGGSAISGDLLAALAGEASPVPVLVHRGYGLPASASGPQTLVIALSHSGTTEETLSCARQAAERGASLLTITSGGDLAPLTEGAGGAAWTFDYDAQPRAALGWLYGLLLGAAARLRLVDDLAGEVAEAVDAMRQLRATLRPDSPSSQNPAKHLAGMLEGRVPVIWGAELLAPVARRWKTQLNENAKTAAYYEEMPELNHNSVVGLQFPGSLTERIAVVELVSQQHVHPRTVIRQGVTRDLLAQAGVPVYHVEAQGESRLAQQMNMIQMGDYVSFYLAIANGVDPTPIENIDWLKEQLARA